jgi:Fe-S-cluster containining protein
LSLDFKNQFLELDLAIIAAAAEPAWADNWNFRSYLIQNVDSDSIDKKVHAINQDISAKIDCTKCGQCCREIYPYMNKGDVERLAKGLCLTQSEILAQTKVEDDGCVSFNKRPCPMLEHNKCLVYNFRPDDCREYPHLHKPDFLAGSIGTIENYGTCPIVYNVYNQLKHSFNYDPSVDYIGDQDPEEISRDQDDKGF